MVMFIAYYIDRMIWREVDSNMWVKRFLFGGWKKHPLYRHGYRYYSRHWYRKGHIKW